MTNNPTIDGVSREFLRKQFQEKNEHRGWFVPGGIAETDTPEGFVYSDFTTDMCWTCYFEANATLQSTIARLEARIAELESGRGEPVAYALTRNGEVCYEADDGVVISNTPGDETDLLKWKPVYFYAESSDIVDEHSAFECWAGGILMGNRHGERLIRDSFGIYRDPRVRILRIGWKARKTATKPMTLPDRKLHVHQGLSHTDAFANGWNACLDATAALNEGKL